MQEDIGDERRQVRRRQAELARKAGAEVAKRYQRMPQVEGLQLRRAQAELVEEGSDVHGDDRPYDHRLTCSVHAVADREHGITWPTREGMWDLPRPAASSCAAQLAHGHGRGAGAGGNGELSVCGTVPRSPPTGAGPR